MSEHIQSILKDSTIQLKARNGSYKTAANAAGKALIEEIVQRNEDFVNRFQITESMCRTLNQQMQLLVNDMKSLGNAVHLMEQNSKKLMETTQQAEQFPETTELKGN